MAFTCPNCGGSLLYSIGDRALKCEHCGSLTDVKTYRPPNVAEEVTSASPLSASGAVKREKGTFDTAVYVCRNCGAELLAPDESLVSFCSYCGGEQLLKSRIQDEYAPGFIVPFEKTKEQCKEAYRKLTAGKLYVPKELKDPAFLEKFRGVYIPYWLYQVRFTGRPVVTGVQKRRQGSTITEKTFQVTAQLDGEYSGIPYDASSYFDDTSADEIMPFNRRHIQKFTPAYLAGFYADRPDVAAAVYEEDAAFNAGKTAFTDISRSLSKKGMTLQQPADNEKLDQLGSYFTERTTNLFPVWFLTWRKKDRVAYAIMNGQSGRLTADLPVDLKKYTLVTAGMAAVIFAVLTLFLSMTARTAVMICAVLALIAAGLFRREAEKIRNHENHVFDPGYFVHGRQVAMPEAMRNKIAGRGEWLRSRGRKKGKKKELSVNAISVLVVILGVFGYPFLLAMITVVGDMQPAQALQMVTFLAFLFASIIALRTRLALRYVKEKSLRLINLVSWLAIGASFLVAVNAPAEDAYYYICCALCAFGAAVTSFGLIRYYNLLATRPLPSFYDRTGGNDDAKK
ncbi:MAG: hypothetical protein K5707_04595 [Clostridia bacterium]|nr:hypothetical protein [Clostridia bacterium]